MARFNIANIKTVAVAVMIVMMMVGGSAYAMEVSVVVTSLNSAEQAKLLVVGTFLTNIAHD